ncbi:hypothetical protein D1BOALGB6SA_8331 [Olavius sp. associated proteobacterium Delta 1]|nr:hypothetical protein D1BOALGB6SA_8331 [Olavius sp. associated proteobacterium Delta 1]
MNIHFREVIQSDLNKFSEWYGRIGGSNLFSNFIPSTFVSFEESKELLWFIILDDDEEIGTIWFERKGLDMASYDMGIYLNRTDFFGKGIGRTVIKLAIDSIISPKNVKELYLDVRNGNMRAKRCYESLGFRTVHLWEKHTESGEIKANRMKLSVGEEPHRTKMM